LGRANSKQACKYQCELHQWGYPTCTGPGNPPECSTVHVKRDPKGTDWYPRAYYTPCKAPVEKEQTWTYQSTGGTITQDVKIYRGTRFSIGPLYSPFSLIKPVITGTDYSITCGGREDLHEEWCK
jgi:hypothetical protein